MTLLEQAPDWLLGVAVLLVIAAAAYDRLRHWIKSNRD